MVTEPIDSWSVLWDTNYRDSILMQDSVRDAFAVALKDLGILLKLHQYQGADGGEGSACDTETSRAGVRCGSGA